MTTTQTPSITPNQMAKSGPRRRWLFVLTGLAAFAATIALFYVEENWRGHRAWENCRRELLARGAVLDWTAFLPSTVPDDQNAFAVPEMQKWFVQNDAARLAAPLGPAIVSNLSSVLRYPGWTNMGQMVVATITIGLPGGKLPGGATVLQWSNAADGQMEAARLMKSALGPMGMDPNGYPIMATKREDFRPVQIVLQCQTAPTVQQLEEFLPTNLFPDWAVVSQKLRAEPKGANSYEVSMIAPLNASDYLAWGATLEPELSVIRRAVQRPYARIEGNNGEVFGQRPNFVAMRNVSQRLAALAECDMVLGQPEKALDELTFLNQVRRLMEFRPSGKPMPLVTAMINTAIAGLYVHTVEDGVRLEVWREPQLAALQMQLTDLNLRKYVAESLPFERTSIIHLVEETPRQELGAHLWPGTDPKTNLVQLVLTGLIPQGWIEQNLVVFANIEQLGVESLPVGRTDIEPRKIAAVTPAIEELGSRATPFNVLARIGVPNFSRAGQTMAHNQTQVNQARIVCALERYRLARGKYPETLEALMPQFIGDIPLDPIGGLPPHYHRTDDGQFILYSIGWTEKDHGGQSNANQAEGDWVWGAE